MVSLAMFMEMLDSTALNTSLPQIAKDLGEAPVNLKLAVTLYLFVTGILVPASAYVVEKFGIKKVFLFAFTVFSIGSIGCGFSKTLSQLVFFRIIQGAGGAFMLPVGRLTIAHVFGTNIVKAMTIVTSIGLLGPLIGPVFGGIVTTYLTWHWIFFINIPFAIVAISLIYVYFPHFTTVLNKRFDLFGFMLVFIGFGLLLLSTEIDETIRHYLIHPKLTFILGLFFLIAFGFYSQYTPHPIVNIKLFKNFNFTLFTLGNFLVRFAVGALPFIIPLFFHAKYDFSALAIGLFMVPFIIGNSIVKTFIVQLVARVDKKNLLILNTIILSIFQFFMMMVLMHWHLIIYVVYTIMIGILNSIQFTLMNSSMFLAVADREKGHANAIYLSLSQLGGCFGVALAALMITHFSDFAAAPFLGFEYAIGLLAGFTGFAALIFCFLRR